MEYDSDEELEELARRVSNWGRWGDDDELGTPNLITPEKTKRALATVREGVTALPVPPASARRRRRG